MKASNPGARPGKVKVRPDSAAAVRAALREEIAPSPLQRRVETLLRRTEYRMVCTPDELLAVQQHRHDEYVAAGNLQPRTDCKLEDENDCGRATRVYTAWLDGELAGSIRLSVMRGSSREGLTVRCFGDVVHPMLDAGLTVVDPNRLTTTSTLSRQEPALVFVVLRLATMATEHYGAQHCLTPIRRQHAPFYRRFLHATRICGARQFPGTTAMMELYDVRTADARCAADLGNPFLIERSGEAASVLAPLSALGLAPDRERTAGKA